MPALTKNRTKSHKKSKWQQFKSKTIESITNPVKLYEYTIDVLFNPDYIFLVTCILIPIEIILNAVIVLKVPCNFTLK